MTAMLWKEARENAYKVATGLAVVVLLHLLRQLEDFNRVFTEDLNSWAPVIGGLCAGVLAMDAIASERSRGTLDFLYVRPTSVARILAAKFAVGAAGLLLVVAAFWAMVYATPLVDATPFESFASQTVADVPLPAMVYAWYLPLLVVYAAVFLASAATENSAEAAAGGGILALVATVLIMLVLQFYPGFTHERSTIQDLINVVLNDSGDLVRIATRRADVWRRSLLAAGLVAAGFVGAWLIAGRFREFTLGRRPLVITGFVLVTLVMTVPRLLPDKTEKVLPIGTVRVGDRPRDVFLLADRAFVLFDDSLAVVDVTVPARPALVTTVRVSPGWTLSRMARLGSHLCAGGWREAMPADSAGVVCFDIANPDRPVISGVAMLVADYDRGDAGMGFEMGRQLIDVEAVQGVLLVPNISESRSELLSLRLDEAGVPRLQDVLVLETYDYPEEVWEGNRRYTRATFVGRHRFTVVPGDRQAFLGLRSGLSIVDVGADGRLRELSRTRLDDAVGFGNGYSRLTVLRGDRVFVRRLWPSEYVELDVSDPSRPRQVRTLDRAAMATWPRQDGRIFRAWGSTVRLYDPADPHRRPVPALGLPVDNPRRGVRSRPILRDDLAFVLIDDELAVFDLRAAP